MLVASRQLFYLMGNTYAHTHTRAHTHTYTHTHIYIKRVKLATIVEGNPKAPFSIATTPMCRGISRL